MARTQNAICPQNILITSRARSGQERVCPLSCRWWRHSVPEYSSNHSFNLLTCLRIMRPLAIFGSYTQMYKKAPLTLYYKIIYPAHWNCDTSCLYARKLIQHQGEPVHIRALPPLFCLFAGRKLPYSEPHQMLVCMCVFAVSWPTAFS